jgi:hypothetical protein
MKILFSFVTGCVFAFSTVLLLLAQAPNDSPVAGKPAVKNFRDLPLGFEANLGQADPAVRFLAHGAGYGIYLKEQEAVIAIRHSRRKYGSGGPNLQEVSAPPDVMRMKLIGTSEAAEPEGLEKLPGVANYFIGNDPSKWRTGVPTYEKVRYASVYPGVDLVYYGNQRQLEYDFVVAPGGSAAPIRLSFNGARSVRLDAEGNLVLKSKCGEMIFQKPLVYQTFAGTRREVESRFQLMPGRSVGFHLGNYDRTAPLIIDPVLVYATLLGGNGLGGNEYGDFAYAVAADATGNAYVTGQTDSSDFPVSSPYDGTYNSEFGMAFVSKINADGSAFVFSTFLGGTWQDLGRSIAVDASEDVYVTGTTFSSDFPLVNPLQTSTNLTAYNAHVFVTKFAPSGQELLYSTYLGGSGDDSATGIAVDPEGNVYVAGETSSENFPTYMPLQATNKATTTNPFTGFVSKINPEGTAFVYSTYLGGSYSDVAYGIAADSEGNAYVTGQALSSDFPVYNALQSKFVGTEGSSSAPFLSKIEPDGSSFVYSTYVGGGATNGGAGPSAYAVAADSGGNAYIVGEVYSTLELPLVNALQAGLGTLDYGAFLSKVNPGGSAFVYSTFLGDTNGALGVAVDGNDNVYVTGSQYCPWDLPTPVNPIGTCSTTPAPGNGSTIIEAFIYEVAADGSAITFASPFGGGYEVGYGIAVDLSGSIYVAGRTQYASAFPTVNALDKTAEGPDEGFVLKINMAASTPAAATPVISPGTGSYTTSQTVSITDTTPNATIYYTTNGMMPTTSSTQYTGTFTVSSTETVEAVAFATGYSTSAVATVVITIETSAATPVISPAAGTYTSAQTVSISDAMSGATIYYTINGTTPTTSSPVYSGPITVSSSETIEAIAAASGYTTSAVASAAYTINIPIAATPTFSPVAGTYTSAQTVSISDATSGATIYYTINGTTPTTSSPVYSGPITVSSSETVEAIATASGYTNSAVASAAYTINIPVAATPTFSPAAGTYTSAQAVTISDATGGATIYYTTNGTTPTTSSTKYTSAITVSSSETVEAMAVASGYTNSAEASATYTINIPVAATPTFSPAAGTYTSMQTVTISDATSGATIYYTTNGSTPTTSSTVYSGPIAVSSSGTLEAIAVASGYSNSAVASATYTITAPSFTLSASPASVSVAQGSSGTSTITVNAVSGFVGTVSLAASGQPSGVTASLAAGSAAGTQVLTLTASTSAAVTSTPVTVTVTGTSGTLTASTNIALTVTAEPSFTAGSGGTASMTVTPGATTGNTGTISVVGTNGFSGTVNLTCAVTTSMTSVNDPPTCSLNSTSVTISGTSAQTSTLTVTTTAASNAKNQFQRLFGPLTGGTALALITLFLVPKWRRNSLAMLGLFILLVSVSTTSCGGGGGSGGGGSVGGNSGTTVGAYTITVAGTSGSISATVGVIALTVQ